jgi:hypothetical protein
VLVKSTPAFVGIVLGIVGAVWVVQGFGLAATGSFMDGRPLWGWLGAALLAGGGIVLAFTLLRR